MPHAGLLIFILVYLMISARRLDWLGLDRPSAALLGAVACVATGALTPHQAMAAIDADTLLLLFGVMAMGATLATDGFFERASRWLARRAGRSDRLLTWIVWGSGALSALITNDAVCVLGAPLVVSLITRHHLPPLPFLLALATASNTGSVATLVGNPQNMLCASLGQLEYRDYLLRALPVAIAALAVNHALIAWMWRRELGHALTPRSPYAPDSAPHPAPPLEPPLEPPPEPPQRQAHDQAPDLTHDQAHDQAHDQDQAAPERLLTRSSLISAAVIAATASLYTLGADLAWTAAGGATALLILQRRPPEQIWRHVDWSLLLFFAGLFVVVEGLVRTGAPDALFAASPLWAAEPGLAQTLRAASIFLIGSNVVSNVPFILVVREQLALAPDPKAAWQLLAMSATFAGNLTLMGSVANIIVAQRARALGGLSFWSHLRVGLPLALISTLLAALWMACLGALTR